MKVLMINETCGIGSHGKICVQLAKEYINGGDECFIAYGRDLVPQDVKPISVRIGGALSLYTHVFLTRVFDKHGFGSRIVTRKFLKWAQKYDPDILWLHNIHGYYINVDMLFKWIKSRPDMEVKWTLHDCWAFTGHCTNFNFCKCDKWKNGCSNCQQKAEYPRSSLLDNSRRNYEIKKRIFCGVKNMTLYTPSEWLAKLVRKSYLSEYTVQVMPNPVDKEVFLHRESDFRQKYGITDKIMVLGVANAWQRSKGFYDFIRLSEMLDDNYVIVLVGVTPAQKAELRQGMIGIERTDSATQLAEIYSAADVFANPSVEETFGMTAYEAALCGTPVIVYKGTACEEIAEKFGGFSVEPDTEALYRQILALTKERE